MIRRSDFYLQCKNEQQFKNKWTALHTGSNKDHFFCIESESTVFGFPDVIEIMTSDKGNTILLYEFKYAKSGKIKFQPTQPVFYKKYKDLNVKVVAYNAVTKCEHIFYAEEILNEDNLYHVSEQGEINLTEVEKKWLKM